MSCNNLKCISNISTNSVVIKIKFFPFSFIFIIFNNCICLEFCCIENSFDSVATSELLHCLEFYLNKIEIHTKLKYWLSNEKLVLRCI